MAANIRKSRHGEDFKPELHSGLDFIDLTT